MACSLFVPRLRCSDAADMSIFRKASAAILTLTVLFPRVVYGVHNDSVRVNPGKVVSSCSRQKIYRGSSYQLHRTGWELPRAHDFRRIPARSKETDASLRNVVVLASDILPS